jgi:hypothetical protein
MEAGESLGGGGADSTTTGSTTSTGTTSTTGTGSTTTTDSTTFTTTTTSSTTGTTTSTTTSTTSTTTTTSSTTSTTSTSTTSTSTTGTTTSTTTTTTTLDDVGCSDGAREGFLDAALYPDIAACSGGFQVAGLLGALAPKCNLGGGDDSANPGGAGCSAADLCAGGWHVCESAAEVAERSPTGCDGSVGVNEPVFFVTGQSGPGCGLCALGSSPDPECGTCNCTPGCLQTDLTANDLFGCGSAGATPGDCGVLDRFSGNVCNGLPAPWSCASGDGCDEAHQVVKPGSGAGGVLCCRTPS